jgi:hypothetical protein
LAWILAMFIKTPDYKDDEGKDKSDFAFGA